MDGRKKNGEIIQIHSLDPDEFCSKLLLEIDKRFDELKAGLLETNNDALLTRRETADYLKISLPCLHDWCNKGILKPYKLGNKTFFFRKEIDQDILKSNDNGQD